jgi:iron complex outermembrane recepter protein
MRRSLYQGLGLIVSLSGLLLWLVPSSYATEGSDLENVSISADWLVQEPNNTQTIRVTGVILNPTAEGLQVILETSPGQRLQPSILSEGNNLIVNISNAVLALPDRKELAK